MIYQTATFPCAKINIIFIDNVKDADIVMAIYNLLEYSENYFVTSGSLELF